MLTHEEFQGHSATPIDSVTEAELDINERERLILLMAKIIRHQQKMISNAFEEGYGYPMVDYSFGGMDWRYPVARHLYQELMDDLLPQLPADWLEEEV